MSKIRKLEGGLYAFQCPGCGENHAPSNKWAFNGDYDKPTFSPSILVTSGHYSPGHSGPCWCTWEERFPNEGPVPYRCGVCHSFVTDGKIQFLNDCTHELAGQTVEIPDWDD